MKDSPPLQLKCEYLTNPLGVSTPFPRFSWVHAPCDRGDFQKAYQVIVSSEKEFVEKEIGDFWDSHKVESESSFQVAYAGEPLWSGKKYYWRVRVWNSQDLPTPYSEIASFEMGLLSEKDWRAKWISMSHPRGFSSQGYVMLGEYSGELIQTVAIYLRKEFEMKKDVHRARAYISGLGFGELHINGQRVGDHVLDPAQTDYRKIALYSVYDITTYLRAKNAIGVIIGNGRHIKNFGFEKPRLIVQIHVEYENEETEKIITDETWKLAHGPLQENGIYFGEKYDARLEQPGWDEPAFDDSAWENACLVSGPALSAQMMPPIRVAAHLRPKKVWNPKPGVSVFDFGQNFSGWVKLQVKGRRKTVVKMRYAELIHEDGTLNVETNQNAEATDIYILRGEGLEVYEPKFTYHGFRYVEISGFPGKPNLNDLEGCFVHTDVNPTGMFSCSHELINQIHHNVLWGQLSNLMSIPTDCPQRDERHGWLGDAHLSAEEAMLNFDMAAFYSKYIEDIKLSQKEDGSLPDTVPPYIERLYPADPAWGAAYYELAWLMYFYYEDKRVLEKHYSSIRKYVDFLSQHAKENILSELGKYGDWCPPGSTVSKRTSLELTSTWYYYHGVLLLIKFAEVLGRKDEAKVFAKLAQDIKESFNRAFSKDSQYTADRVSSVASSADQTSNVLPLYLDMVPEGRKERVLQSLLQSIISDCDYHLNTGIVGTRYLLDVLTENGYIDAAYRIATQEGYPGWGYMVQEGATTLWERWEKITGRGMNSHNHIMLGSVDAWFYKMIAGVSCTSPGWKTIQVKPPLLRSLTRASATLQTIRGELYAFWQKEEDSFLMSVRIPCGSTAALYLPLLWEKVRITESEKILCERGRLREKIEAVSFSKEVKGYLVFEILSGDYEFSMERLP